MSPNTNALAYKDFTGETTGISAVEEFAPELSVLISKRKKNDCDAAIENNFISITGSITVSF